MRGARFAHGVIAFGLMTACGISFGSGVSDEDVAAFATDLLNDLQPKSIEQGVEFCGVIYLAENGSLVASRPMPGGEAHCDIEITIENTIASYHTHGSFSQIYDSEVPSSDDMISDFEAGTDGYISTPSGRIWHIDVETKRAIQLCTSDCVASDPADDSADQEDIPLSFTLEELLARENGEALSE